MQTEAELIISEDAIREVADEWAFPEYRTERQRTFAASCARIALKEAFGMNLQKDAIELMATQGDYKRVWPKIEPCLFMLCAQVAERSRNGL